LLSKKYYGKVGSTYRNPHFPGVRLCIFAWLNRWWEMESINSGPHPTLIFDMACGSGEATLSVNEWWTTGRHNCLRSQEVLSHLGEQPNAPAPRRKASSVPIPPCLPPHTPNPQIIAADPHTSVAYLDRTSLPCSPLSFRDIAGGALPPLPAESHHLDMNQWSNTPVIDMVICSFALHLINNPSELFALLWELSTKSRWLVILAPHKKPEIKDGWGWMKWNSDAWEECRMSDHCGQYLKDRVHCRIYRSINV